VTDRKPLGLGTVTPGSPGTVDQIQEIPVTDAIVAERIVDDDGELWVQRRDAAKLSMLNARGPAQYQDSRKGCVILHQSWGFWQAGTIVDGSGIETNPEKVSAFYQTRVAGTYTGSTGIAPIAGDIVTGSTLGWTARVVSVNLGAGSFLLSLYSGTVAGAGAEVLSTGTGDWTGVTMIAGSVGATTGYHADDTGEKAPFIDDGLILTGYFNCIGSVQNEAFPVSAPSIWRRFPLQPESYETFYVPNNEFGEGAILELVMSGVVKQTTPHDCALYFTVNIGTDLFHQAIGGGTHPSRITFAVPVPPIASELPFFVTIKLSSYRCEDRTEGNLGLLTLETDGDGWMWGSSGAVRVAVQRGSDKVVDPDDFPGFDFEGDDDQYPEHRAVGVWMAVGTDAALPKAVVSSGEFYATVRTLQARLFREGIA